MINQKNHARSRRINSIAKEICAKNYLEIGVSKGVTFHGVNIGNKIGVDPNFKFDTKIYENDKINFVNSTSDEYFENLNLDQKFDIIYLDGLHTFEQTYRDFCNAIIHTHEKSAILIDDTVPVDVFSSINSQKKCIELRRKFGNPNVKAWHGDVYKIIFAINVFHPSLQYKTIMNSGNPQTLVWRSKNRKSNRLNMTFAEISNIDYAKFLDYISYINQGEEIESIKEFLEDILKI